MKRIVCIAIWALAFLSAGFLFASRAGQPRSENAPSPETEQPAAENAQESESSVPSQEGVQEEAAPKAEPAREKPRRGWGGRKGAASNASRSSRSMTRWPPPEKPNRFASTSPIL